MKVGPIVHVIRLKECCLKCRMYMTRNIGFDICERSKIPYHSHWPGSDNYGDYGCWTALCVCYFLCMRLFGLVKESVRDQEKWA